MAEPRIADSIVLRPVAALIPYVRNARTHSPEQVAQIAASIAEFGFTNPVLVDEAGGIIAGHGRVLAARQLHMAAVPTIELAYLTEAQRRAYRIADNKLALNAGWDVELLRLELSELKDFGFPLTPIGFSDGELSELFADRTEGLTDPDDVPPLPIEPISRLGDLWLCGRHRLLCGDATNASDVARILAGVQPHLMVTDPPYGVGFERGKFVGRNKAAQGPAFESIVNDNLRGEDLAKFITKCIGIWAGECATVYMWSSVLQGYSLLQGISAAGFKVQSQIIWRKTPFVIGRADYHWQHEFCWYGFKGPNHPWYGGRDKGTVWDIPKAQKMEHHPTAKPIECMKRPIENNSSPGQAVYDPFLGSGTTIIAAEMTGRACYAIEIAPAYVDVAVKRWQHFTGETGLLDGTGRSFAAIAAARQEGVPAAPAPVQARKRAAG